MDKFNNLYKKYKRISLRESGKESVLKLVENELTDEDIPLLGSPDDLLIIKHFPIRFDLQCETHPDMTFRYALDTNEDYQSITDTLLADGQVGITFLPLEEDVPYEYIKLIWELDFEGETISLLPKKVVTDRDAE